LLLNSIFYVVAVYIMSDDLPIDKVISLNEAEALMQANLKSTLNNVVDDIGNELNTKITDLFDKEGVRQHYINEITHFIENKLIDPKTTKQINKILALQTPAFQYKNEENSGHSSTPGLIGRTPQPDSSKTQPTIFGRKIPTDSPKTKPEIIGSGRTSSSTRKRAKKGKRFNKTQKQHGGDYVDIGLFTGVTQGPMKRLEKVVTDKLSTYHIENAIGTGFYRAMGQAVFDENTLNLAVDNMLEKQLETSKPSEFKNALIKARCPNR
jgi:hypothetical protein